MLGALIGLLLATGAILLTIVVPILSLLRAREARRIARSMADRLEALEAAVARLEDRRPPDADLSRTSASAPAEVSPAPSPDPSAPPAFQAATLSARPADVAPGTPTGGRTGPAAPPGPSVLRPVDGPTVDQPAVGPGPAGARTAGAEDLEQRIGSRWLLYAGLAAVVLGVSYFVKFAFDSGWISEPMRVAAGLAVGAALVAGGLRLSRRGLAWFGQALAGGGILTLYLSIYAALHFYALVSAGPAFAMMIAVTAAAAWLADRHQSQILAGLALVGGFATPVLIGGERNAPGTLFTYMAVLVAGTALLARRHDWPLLAAGSYVSTAILVLAWLAGPYDASHWLLTELFLTLYVVLFTIVLRDLIASPDRSLRAVVAIGLLATAPVAYHLASIVLLARHPAAWLVYLVLASAAGLAVAQRLRSPMLRLGVLLLVGGPALLWLLDLAFPRWLAAGVGVSIAIYTLHLAAQWEAAAPADERGTLNVPQAMHTQANGLLLPFTLYLTAETHSPSWSIAAVTVPAMWNVVLALAARTRAPRMAMQFTVLGAALTAAAVVVAVDGPAVPAAWVAEGVFLAWLAMRERSRVVGWCAVALILGGYIGTLGLLERPLAASDMPLFNAPAAATLLVIGLLGWLAVRMRADGTPAVRQRPRDVLIALVNLLAVVFLSAEIHAFFQQRIDRTAALAAQLTLSVSWALYALVLVAVGIRRRYAPARYFAIALFGITSVKVLAHDIAGLDRLYRMLTVLGVGVLLLVASYLYNRRGITRSGD